MLPGVVALDDVVSFHVDEAAGTPVGEGYDGLLWYDVTELANAGHYPIEQPGLDQLVDAADGFVREVTRGDVNSG